jgi:uncharacterized protein HemX
MRKGVLLFWVALLAMLSFGAGLSSGVLFVYKRQAASEPESISYAEKLKEELPLSETQFEKIQNIVDSHEAQMEELYRRCETNLREETRRLNSKVDEEISRELTSEQRKKFKGIE